MGILLFNSIKPEPNSSVLRMANILFSFVVSTTPDNFIHYTSSEQIVDITFFSSSDRNCSTFDKSGLDLTHTLIMSG